MAEDMSKKFDKSKYRKIPKESFPINDATHSRYAFFKCSICNSNCFIEWLTFSTLYKRMCPRCGRYILTDSGVVQPLRMSECG